ncbi:calcium-binding protein [Leptothoe spongobia]|uniref:Uncharacterized protein n=1 Tax=Leptothoe spongobia TAU-MAC 1115 TaxID=1967444 RepID=A0A947GFN8_9CYAN|nr:hypothetical protein [Leptothoe spongobia]MBT9314455.1 hypothetical protein [Leptothoe spongobia TAU-MAC 1115]
MDETGAGGSSTATATSPSGETSSSSQEVFEPGATSSQSSGSATATTDGATTETDVAVPANNADQSSEPSTDAETSADHSNQLIFQIGSEHNAVLTSTSYQDIMIGSEGSNTFELSNTGKASIQEADVITNFDINNDYLQLSDGLTEEDLVFENVDLNHDGNHESTVIRLGEAGDILAVVLNTVLTDTTVLIKATSDNTDDNGIATSVEPESLSSSQSESTAWVNDDGAGSRAAAQATSPSGETSSIEAETFDPDGNSSQAQATAIATPEGASTSASTIPSSENPIDYLIGTASADILISDGGPDILIGGSGPDTFVVEKTTACASGCPSFITDFNLEEGDRIQLGAEFFFMDDIVLEPHDLDSDGIMESTAIQLASGGILAIVLSTVDPLGNTVLSKDAITPSLPPSQTPATLDF